MKNLGLALIALGLLAAILKLVGAGGPAATAPLILLALVFAGGGFVLYRVNRRKELRDRG